MTKTTIDDKKFHARMDAFMRAAATTEEEVAAEIIVTDKEVEKYWRVAEFGSVRDEKPWPEPKAKTRAGRGGRVVTKQAPQGFIFRHAERFTKFLKDAYLRIFETKQAPLTRTELVSAANAAAENALELIKAGAPVDSGKLKNSLAVRKAQ